MEREKVLSQTEIENKLSRLTEALRTNDNAAVKQALHEVVPTFHDPEEVNRRAQTAQEMKNILEIGK